MSKRTKPIFPKMENIESSALVIPSYEKGDVEMPVGAKGTILITVQDKGAPEYMFDFPDPQHPLLGRDVQLVLRKMVRAARIYRRDARKARGTPTIPAMCQVETVGSDA